MSLTFLGKKNWGPPVNGQKPYICRDFAHVWEKYWRRNITSWENFMGQSRLLAPSEINSNDYTEEDRYLKDIYNIGGIFCNSRKVSYVKISMLWTRQSHILSCKLVSFMCYRSTHVSWQFPNMTSHTAHQQRGTNSHSLQFPKLRYSREWLWLLQLC